MWGGGFSWSGGLGGSGCWVVLVLELDIVSLNFCCVIRCVVLSRYFNFFEF